MAERFDAVVVGGGHNGLVAATYLARGGLEGARARAPAHGRRGLRDRGAVPRLPALLLLLHLPSPPGAGHPGARPRRGTASRCSRSSRPGSTRSRTGRHLVVWDDTARTAAEIERYSKRDAAAYPRWIALWERAAALLHPYFLAPAPTYAELAARVRGTPDEELLETLLTRPMWDLVHEHFESDLMRAHTLNAQDLGDPRAPGSALVYAYIKVNLRSAPGTVGIVKGGMGGITQAMARAATEAGVTIRTGAEVARVDVQERPGERRRPARTGVVSRADAVVSNADPKRTFLGLVPPDALPARVPRADRRALDPRGVLQVPRRAPGAAGLLAPISGAGFDPRYLAQVKICPSTEAFLGRLAGRPGGAAAAGAAHGSADPHRLRPGACAPPATTSSRCGRCGRPCGRPRARGRRGAGRWASG